MTPNRSIVPGVVKCFTTLWQSFLIKHQMSDYCSCWLQAERRCWSLCVLWDLHDNLGLIFAPDSLAVSVPTSHLTDCQFVCCRLPGRLISDKLKGPQSSHTYHFNIWYVHCTYIDIPPWHNMTWHDLVIGGRTGTILVVNNQLLQWRSVEWWSNLEERNINHWCSGWEHNLGYHHTVLSTTV